MKNIFTGMICIGLLSSCCSLQKANISSISYYSGNMSLPPAYGYMNTVKIDSNGITQTQLAYGKTIQLSPENFDRKTWDEMLVLTKKLPKKPQKFKYAVGSITSGLSIYNGDSLFYSQSWQPDHKISKKLSEIERKLNVYLIPMPSPPPPPLPDEENESEQK